MHGGGAPGKSCAGQIHGTPEEVDRTGLSDERRAKVRHDPVGLHELLPKRMHRIGIVSSMLIVLRERDGGVYLIGLAQDMCFDVEVVERRERLSVELSDGFGRQLHGLLTTVTVADRKPMVDEVELHVEQAIPVWNCAGGQSPGADIQRDLPPMVYQW